MTWTGWRLPAGLVAGSLTAHVLFYLQTGAWAVVALLALIAAGARSAFWICIGLALGWTSFVLHVHLADRLNPELNGSALRVEGRIIGLPERHEEYTRFRFRPLEAQPAARLPATLLTYWHRDAPELRPGETWMLELQVRPPWGRVNFHGGDRERWLFASGIGGLATARSGVRLQAGHWLMSAWDGWRLAIRSRLAQAVADDRQRGIITALAIADRSGLSEQDRRSLARTGTAHLMAISGLHIGLAAGCGFWLARLILFLWPVRWGGGRAWAMALIAGTTAAWVYAALAGFGTSTVRALLMLGAGVAVLLLRRRIHPGQAWFLALAGVMLLDPLAVLGAGFWLSFAATGVLLLLVTALRIDRFGRWGALLLAQAGIMLALLPLSAWWFQQFSLAGLAANLLAIPWVSLITVPLVLLGLILLPLSGLVAGWVFGIAGQSAAALMSVLGWISALPPAALDLPQPSLWQAACASIGALALLLPRGLAHRWLGLVLLLPLFGAAQPPGKREVQIDVLDVGQGTAVLVNSRRHLLLYDSGPGNGKDFDLVGAVIEPAIRHSGHSAPHRILISHGDLDHAGGLAHLRETYPEARFLGNLRARVDGMEACNGGLQWGRGGVRFTVLHPTPYLPYLGNDSSCVLKVELGGHGILLPGDISEVVERRLVDGGGPAVSADFLLVPHHGSKTSSSPAFLRAVRPEAAVATAGNGNRFGFPLQQVVDRYREEGITFWSTGACGAIRLVLDDSGRMRWRSARVERAAPWRWPAAAACP